MRVDVNDCTYEFMINLLPKFQQYLELDDLFSQYIVSGESVIVPNAQTAQLDQKPMKPCQTTHPEAIPPQTTAASTQSSKSLEPIEPLVKKKLESSQEEDKPDDFWSEETPLDTETYSLNKFFKLFKQKYNYESMSTLKNNMSQLRSILKLLGKADVNIEHFSDAKQVIETLNDTNLNTGSIKNYIHMIIKLYNFYDKTDPPEYFKEVGRLKKKINSSKSFSATTKEKPLLVYLKENESVILERLINSTLTSNVLPIHYEKLALFGLYIDYPPFRREWGNMICVTEDVDDKKTNYYNCVTGKVSLNSFKNKSDRKPQMNCNLNTHPSVKNKLDDWIDAHPMKGESEYPLFLSKTGKPMKDGTFNLMMSQIFGKKISVNILRKYYVSKHVFTGIHKPEEISEIHRVMNHSADTCLKEYAKVY